MLNPQNPELRRFLFVVLDAAPAAGVAFDATRAGLTVAISTNAELAARQLLIRRGQRVIYLGETEHISVRQLSRYGHTFARSVDFEPFVRRILVAELDQIYNSHSALPVFGRVREIQQWAKHFDYPETWYTDSAWQWNCA